MSKILIVEDDADNRAILRQQLYHLGHDVIEASTGFEALDWAAKDTPDLVILDIMMPKIDGREVARRLRNELKLRDVPILAATVLFQKEDAQTCIDAGCNDVLVKPFNLQELRDKIHQLLPTKH
jgi:CheY-like chemotaxis protein